MKKRLLSLLLIFGMLFSLMPLPALAEESDPAPAPEVETVLPDDGETPPENEAGDIPSDAAPSEDKTEDAPSDAAPPEDETEDAPSDAAPPEDETEDTPSDAAPPEDETEDAPSDAAPPEEETVMGLDEEANTSVTVPSDAVLFVGTKVKHYLAFTPVEPVRTADGSQAGTTTYYFELANGTYNFRVSGPGYVTYGGTFKKTAEDCDLTVDAAQLKPDGKSSSTIDRDTASNSGYNVADLYLNINPQGYLKLNSGETFQLVNLRSWEAVDTTTSNYFIEPDYHYTVLDESGRPGSGVVTVSDSGLVTAEGNGTAIVLVTYDAMTLSFNGGADQFYGAIWPENTGVFVVSVGAGESGIHTGMTLNAGRNTESSKLAGDALDAEHDVIYFLGSQGEYTFTPDSGCTVSVANPAAGTALTFSGFVPVSANRDGSFTVPLTEGRNIVKVTRNGKSEYQVITAKQVSYTVNGGSPVKPGDTLSIVFDQIYHPVNKLAGVYNMSAFISYSQMSGYTGTSLISSTANQYKFASTAAAQTVSNLMIRTVTSGAWGETISYKKGNALTVPADYMEPTLTLSGGTLVAYGYGDPYGGHRTITLEEGKDPNFTASMRDACLGQLPDLVIPITVDRTVESIEIVTPPTQTVYFAEERFDPSGMVVKAVYSDGTENDAVTSYTFSPEVLAADTTAVTVSYGGKTASVPVTITPLELTAIEVTVPPAKTAYSAGDVFDPTGMVVTGTYNSGKTAPVTDYTYAPNRELTAEDTAITVQCGGLTATAAITVSPAAAPGPDAPTHVTVQFTLLGDSHHDSDSDGITHTLKDGGLTTWIAQTSVTVPQGAKIIDVVTRALGLAGIPYENPTGNYIVTIRGLGEFSNGSLSGWMYTLNGTHPTLGVAEQTVKNGDAIVFHYTDDYTVERASESWTGGGGSGSGSTGGSDTAAVPEITVSTTVNSSGEAAVQVTDAMLRDAIAALKSSGAETITISPVVSGTASAVSVNLPASTAQEIVRQTGASLAIETAVGSVDISNAALSGLLDTAKSGDLTVSVEAQTPQHGAELLAQLSGSFTESQLSGSSVTEVAISSGGTDISAWGGQPLTLRLPVSGGSFQAGARCTVYQFSADGSSEAHTVSCAAQDGALYVVLTVTHLSTFVVLPDADEPVQLPFTDVSEGDWWYDAVVYAYENGLFNGTSTTAFSPRATMTRSMLVTVLWRLEGEPEAAYAGAFSDVAEGKWYTDAVAWAHSLGIVTGDGGRFDPDGAVTREQIAAILFRYAQYKGWDVSASASLSAFPDGGTVSGWAAGAMAWAAGTQLIQGGDGGQLSPQSGATRAEVAAILMRLLNPFS